MPILRWSSPTRSILSLQQQRTNVLPILTSIRSYRARGRVKRGELIENIPIERLDSDGNGRTTIEWNRFRGCSFNDTELIVPGALPGETVTVKIGGVRGNGKKYNEVFVHVFARRNWAVEPGSFGSPKLWMNSTEILDYHKDSPYELPEEEVCGYFDKRHDELSCSGCQIPHLQYQRQLLWKRKLLSEMIPNEFQHKQDNDKLIPIVASGLESFNEHRTYSQILHSPDKWDPPIIGHYARKANAPGERREIVVTGGHCPRKEPPASEAERAVMAVLAEQYKIDREYYSAYDFWRHRGNFMGINFHIGKDIDGRRHVLVNILMTMDIIRDKMDPIVDALIKIPQVDAIVANKVDRIYYPGFNIKSDDRHQMLLYGDEPYIPHTLTVGADKKKIPIKIGVGDVLWPNATIHKEILDTVAEFAKPNQNDVIWDIWSANGASTLTLADKCRHIVSLDASRTRVNGLKENLRLNPNIASKVTPVLANMYKEDTLVYLSGHIHRNRALQLLDAAYKSLEDARSLRSIGVIQGINRTKSLERKHAKQFTELPADVSEVLKAEAKLALAEGTIEGDNRFNLLVKHMRSTRTPEGLQPILPIKQPWMLELTPQMQKSITSAYQQVRSRIDRGEAADNIIQTSDEAERESQLVDAAYMWLMNKSKPTTVERQLAESENRRRELTTGITTPRSVEPTERSPALPGAGRPFYSWETLDKAKEKDDIKEDFNMNMDAIDQLDEEGPVFEITPPTDDNGHEEGDKKYDLEAATEREAIKARTDEWKTTTLPSPDIVVISFPPKSKKSEKEGNLPKLFRRWLRASAVKRIVAVFTDPKGLSKDVGHLKQLGYSADDIKVIDAQPGTMDVVVVVQLNLKSAKSNNQEKVDTSRLYQIEEHTENAPLHKE